MTAYMRSSVSASARDGPLRALLAAPAAVVLSCLLAHWQRRVPPPLPAGLDDHDGGEEPPPEAPVEPVKAAEKTNPIHRVEERNRVSMVLTASGTMKVPLERAGISCLP